VAILMKNKQFKNINQSFMDEIDATTQAEEFINSIYGHYLKITPIIELEKHLIVKPSHVTANNKADHVLDGASYTLWHGELIIATANIRRTPNFNYSYLTCHVIEENLKHIKPI
jgi:hypothetical protein